MDEQRLRETLLLRGGAALWLFHGGARPSQDLDFMALRRTAESPGPESMADLLDALLSTALPRFFRDYDQRFEWIVANLSVDVCDLDRLTDCTTVYVTSECPQPIMVCTLEDILSDKLVSLVEGPVGHRKRERDLFDVASMLSKRPRSLNLHRLAQLARGKARVRQRQFCAAALATETRQWLAPGYDALRQQLGDAFIPLPTAWEQVVALVRRLDAIPT
jgi:hypothetical protein